MDVARVLLQFAALGFLLAALLVNARLQRRQPPPPVDPDRPGPYAWPEPEQRPRPKITRESPTRLKVLLGISAACTLGTVVLLTQEVGGILW